MRKKTSGLGGRDLGVPGSAGIEKSVFELKESVGAIDEDVWMAPYLVGWDSGELVTVPFC